MIHLIFCLLSAFGLATIGIGLIWVLPMFYAVIGIIFRNVYGLKQMKNSD